MLDYSAHYTAAMILLDAFFRFSGIGLLWLLAIKMLSEQKHWPSTPYLFLSCISVIALFISYSPEPFRLSGPFQAIVRFLDVPHLIFVWLFALSLFSKDFSLRVFHLAVGLLYCLPIFWLRIAEVGAVPSPPQEIIVFVSGMSLLLMGHLAYTTLRGRKDDLLEKRRACRLYFVTVVLLVAVAAAITESALIGETSIDKTTIKILCIWPAIAWASYWLLTTSNDALNFVDNIGVDLALSADDLQLKQKLESAMIDQEAFKAHDLKISSLAGQLGVSQHRLRRLINQSLGYENFSAFINHYRIEAVKESFRDPDKTHIPILTIAMNCGFNSLSPFNRVFKEIEGITPSQYRKSKSK